MRVPARPLQAAAVRAQLEAQLDAKADELAAAQRQLAALQQQLLAQRSAGAGAGSAATAEAEQLRRQLASERQRREQAELAAAHAGQVCACVCACVWRELLSGSAVCVRTVCWATGQRRRQTLSPSLAAALGGPSQHLGISIPITPHSTPQAGDAEAAALEEQASLLHWNGHHTQRLISIHPHPTGFYRRGTLRRPPWRSKRPCCASKWTF